MKERVQYTLQYGPCGLKTNDFSRVEIHRDDNAEKVMNVDPTEVQCPENAVRKEEKLMDHNKEYTIRVFSCLHHSFRVQKKPMRYKLVQGNFGTLSFTILRFLKE